MERLDTERLHLRPFVVDDAEGIWEAVYNDPAVCQHFCGLTWSLAEVKQWTSFHHLDTRMGDLGYLAITHRADGRIIGLVGLRPYVATWIVWQDDPHAVFARMEMELTYALGQDYWGQGYAAESCNAVIGYAFRYLRLQRLAYAVNVQNTNSWRLMKRLGFRFQRNLRPDAWDTVIGVLDNHLLDED